MPCLLETYQARTLHIEAKMPGKPMAVGSTVKVPVTVTRPAHEDPAGQGHEVDPPYSSPAADVTVAAGVAIRDVYLYGTGLTNQDGKAVIKVRLKSYTPAGMASLRMLAQYRRLETACLILDEYGLYENTKAFRTTR